jgi:hypothetical protein
MILETVAKGGGATRNALRLKVFSARSILSKEKEKP